jgi:muconolactone D-isomerase
MEFLVHIEVHRPARATDADAAELSAAEKVRAGELIAQGMLRRVWRVPGQWAHWGLWEAADATELHAAICTLPLWPWMRVQVHPMARHALDPG